MTAAAMTGLSWARLNTPVGPVSVGCTAAGVAQVRYGDAGQARALGASGLTGVADPAAGALAEAARRELTEYFRGHRQVFDVAVDWTATTGLQRRVLTLLASSVSYGHTISYGALAHAAGLTDAGPVTGGRTGPVTGGRTAPVTGGRTAPVTGGRTGPVTGGRTGPVTGERTGRAAGTRAAGQPGRPSNPPVGLAARTVGTIMGGNPIPVIVPCHRVVASDGLGGYSGGAGVEVKRWLLILEGSLPPTLDWQPMAQQA